MYRVSQVLMYQKTCKKRAKRASQVLNHQERASQVLIYQKDVQKCAKTCKNVQKRENMQKHASQVLIYQKKGYVPKVQKCASQIFLDPIQKCAPERSVQLEAVYLEALL